MVMPAEIGGHHYIEESVSVYLFFDFEEDRWCIDGATIDGEPLDSPNPQAPFNGECECDDRDACDEAKRHTEGKTLPTADELVELLREAIRDRR